MTVGDEQFLYRYRHLQGEHREWTKRILTDSILYFASPSTFNDPFDCKVHFRSSFSTKELKHKYADLVRQFRPQLNRSQRKTKVARDVNSINKKEFQSNMTRRLQDATESLGILSFSGTARNILLWSHYASGHTGICLKFLAGPHTPFFGYAQPLEYTSDYPEINLLDPPDRQVQAFLLTKASDWQYEQEWRIIDHDHGKGDRVFPEELLVEVILGARMQREDKEAVAVWVHKRKTPVKLSEARVGSGSFLLDIVPYVP